MIPICYVVGPTNAGKTTFLNFVSKRAGVGLVEIGKMMRAKYPPEHFAGQAAPAHTATEAWQMFLDKIDEHEAAGKVIAFADGQPRDTTQTLAVLARPDSRVFLHLWAPSDVRTARAIHRDRDDPMKLELSMQRIISDDPACYNVLSRLACRDECILHYDTSSPDYSLEATFARAVQCAGARLPPAC